MEYPNSLFAAIAELDAMKPLRNTNETIAAWIARDDLRYRALLSTASRDIPHKSIGWRGKAILFAGYRALNIKGSSTMRAWENATIEASHAIMQYRVEWYSGGFDTIEAADFETASKKAIRIAKRRFLKISALIQIKKE